MGCPVRECDQKSQIIRFRLENIALKSENANQPPNALARGINTLHKTNKTNSNSLRIQRTPGKITLPKITNS